MKKFRKLLGVMLSACMLFSGLTSVPTEKTAVFPAIEAHASGYNTDEIIRIARSYLGNTTYTGWCLKYVHDVFDQAGVYITRLPSATDAQHAWLRSTSRDIPVGACVFFASDDIGPDGHIEIYTGNGNIIGSGNLKNISERQMNDWYWSRYVGWGWYGNIEPEPAEEAPSPVDYKNIPEGIYNLYNVGSERYMNYAWGVSDPNPIRIYNKDDSQEQKFTLEYVKNGKYIFKINHADGGYVNCECPTENDIRAGIKLTGRTVYEDDTQRFWITPVGNDEYILSSGHNKNLVIGAESSDEASGLFIQNYKKSNALQRWKLVPVDVPEEFTDAPTEAPTEKATEEFTEAPVDAPTEKATEEFTEAPEDAPTEKTTEKTTEATEPEELTVEKTELSLKAGEQYTIKASQKNLTYQSSDPAIAVVSKKGVITAMKEGYVIITVMNSNYDAVPIAVTVTSPAPALTAGDADGSGEVDILDVITVNKSILGKETLTDAQIKAIDFNKNGKPDADESLTLLKFIVGLIKTL